MSINIPQPGPEDHLRAYRLRLKDEPLPTVVIDCATANVLAANAGGLYVLGLTPADRLPATLDSAMPAVAALRDLVQRGLVHRSLAQPVRCALVFWRHGRATTRLCDISSIDPSRASHAAIAFHPHDAAADCAPPPHSISTLPIILNGAVAANDDLPARIVRDDSETLKEIARRIREGQRAHAAEAAIVERAEAENVQPVEVAPMETNKPDSSENAQEPESSTIVPPGPDQDSARSTMATPDGKLPVSTAPLEEPNTPAAPPAKRALPIDDIAKLAHELKTPLSAIAAASEIMRDQSLGPMGNDKYLGYAADIHDSAKHALAVISEMLAAASVDGPPTSGPKAVDLTELATRAISSLQPLASQRGLTLSLDGEPNLMPVRASATAIRQILLNLLTNALKFTPSGGEVRVATGYLDDGAVYLVVRDTGDGMGDEALDHVFDDGRDDLRVRTGGGRGIGLRLARRLAAENGAEFEIDSAPGRGTVVLVAFAKDLVGVR